jgi:hypothetical protein
MQATHSAHPSTAVMSRSTSAHFEDRESSVSREHAVPEGLFVRALLVASAYELHLLPALDQYGPHELSKEQARTLADEVRLIRSVLNDDVLDPHLAALYDVALWCARSPGDASIVIEGP